MPPTAEAPARPAGDLTTEIVRAAYLLFLGREPENDRVVQQALAYGSVARLRAAFIDSPEFRGSVGARPILVPVGAAPLDVEWRADPLRAAAMLDYVRQTWTRLGDDKPHWSVLSHDEFAPGRIGQTADLFFASGSKDHDDLVAMLRRHGLRPEHLPRLFEFGCGLGRVTAHLARSFSHVTACDVSRTHLAQAMAVIERAGIRNVDLHLVQSDEFGMTAPFDLWFSRLVLQHNPPPIVALVLRRALTMLAPGGVALFQLPTHAVGYRFSISDYLRGLPSAGDIEMHVLPQPIVFRLLREHGCEPIEVLEDLSAGPSSTWSSTTFIARKRPQ